MTTKNYLIRKKIFDYQGDYYSLIHFQLGEIVAVFQNKQDAQDKFQQLTIEYLAENTLSEYYVYQLMTDAELQTSNQLMTDAELQTSNQLMTDAELQTSNQLMIQRTGAGFLNQQGRLVDTIPEQFSDADRFYFAEQVGLLAYQIDVVDDESYVIWDTQQQQYLRLPDPYGNPFSPDEDYVGSLIWGQCPDFLQQHAQKEKFTQQLITQIFSAPSSRIGRLEQLSDQPDQLAHFLQQQPTSWIYQAEQLKPNTQFSTQDYPNLKQLNSLLKQPFFEIHTIDFATLKTLIDLETICEVR